ncbi:MAG: DUF7507 domain-containing protein [Planctomycetota bacterium]|jgi:uncharacterized repeat protein (TIGR01451 family)
MNRRIDCIALCVVAVSLAGLCGCRDHYPHSFALSGGDISRVHGEPAEGGYYEDWDPYAASVEVTPGVSVNPVGTQHMLIATVKDKDGKPLPNRRVEWIIPDGGVGAIVEVDESGWRNSRGHKVTSRFAVSHTNNCEHVLTRGNDDPADDIHLKRGQSWCTITSAVEGTTGVVVYVPAIYNWDKHKVIAKKHWYDVKAAFPPDATNPVGTPHRLAAKVITYSDGKPLAGYEVTFKILSGPSARLMPGGGQTATVETGSDGVAEVTLEQTAPAEGANEIQIDVVRPEKKACCKPAVHVATGKAVKTWVGPRIAIRKSAPATARVGQAFRYDIVVTNPSSVDARNVAVTDELPDGISYVSSSPEASVSGQRLSWSLGTLSGGASRALSVQVRAERTGKFTNCADVTADFGLSARDCADTVVTQPKLAISKKAPEEVLFCEMITYTFIVTNEGDAPATNVRLSDRLPEGLLWRDQYREVTADFGTLNPGEAKKVEYSVKPQKTGTFVNTAVVTADDDLRAEASVRTVVLRPSLVITKTGPEAQFIGRAVTYTIKVANRGDGEARNTILTDMVPANAEYVRSTGGGSMAAGKVTWSLGTIDPGESREVTITLRPTALGRIRNTATATAYCSEGSGEAVTMIKGIPAILLECVDVEDPIEVGTNVTYVITVTNQGSAVGTNIVIKCTLPAGQEFVSATGPTDATAEENVISFEPLGSLAAKAKATYRVVAKGTEAGDVRFKVSLTSDQIKAPVEETESTNIYE